MRFINESFRKTRRLRELVNFVAALSPCSEMAGLVVRDAPEGMTASGIAWQTAPPDSDTGIAPSLVVVDVPLSYNIYPYTLDTPDEVGVVRVTSWAEEFVFYLSHEVRHVRQMWDATILPANIDNRDFTSWAEIDADLFAVVVLNAFRDAGSDETPESPRYPLRDTLRGTACKPSASVSTPTTFSSFDKSPFVPAP